MKFKRLLTVGLMALFCAGTAMAVSQLNAVQVAPKATTTTINLRTTGSYAHKEYRPDEHLALVDLTGVTADAAVERAVELNSAALKSYKLSSYTGPSGLPVTRIELVLGDKVSVDVNDQSDGLKIQLTVGGASQEAVAHTSPTVATSPSTAPKPVLAAQNTATTAPVPSYAVPIVKDPVPASQKVEHVAPSTSPVEHAVVSSPTTIRAISVQQGHGTLDIVIAGPSAAQPFMLKNPDRLVLDFSNAMLSSSVKNIAVHTKDVLNVRVGRFQAEPPVIRVVIDLSGPHTYDVVPSAKQVVVRVKLEDAGVLAPVHNAASAPALASADVPAASGKITSEHSNPSAHAVVSSATPQAAKDVAVTTSNSQVARPVVANVPAKVAGAEVAAVGPAKTEVVVKAPAPVEPVKVAAASSAPAAPTTALVAPGKPAVEVAAKAPVSSNKATDSRMIALTEPEVIVAKAPLSEPDSKVIAAPMTGPGNLSQTTATAGANGQTPVLIASARKPEVEAEMPSANTSGGRDSQISEPKARAESAAETLGGAAQHGQGGEIARMSAPVLAQSQPSSTPVASPKYTGEPVSVNLKDVDLKDFFRLIHEISGLNIVLDPNVHGSLTLVLDDVPWDQALDIVLRNNSLDREIQGNVLRIAARDTLRSEAVSRRAESEAEALAVDRQTVTRFLSYAKSKDVMPTIKKFLSARGDVIADERTNALIISDIPSVLPTLDHLISQLDKKSQEVAIEVRVVSASRTFTRDIGVQLGFNWGNGVSSFGGSNSAGTTTGTTGGGTSTSSGTAIPLFSGVAASSASTGFSISNITKMYGIDAILTAAENHNLAKVLSRPRIVTQSNIKAEVKQGVRIPVATAGTGNTIGTVSYLDCLLRLSVTPQITADNTIFLQVDVENTQPDGVAAGGDNYIIATQEATTQVLVTDGDTVVIGGVIQTTNSVSTTQTPILGSIPWLGNLFKERLVKTDTEELIFFITPKIIRT